jgi:GMP synthase-like glutamine amidotransferase
MRILVVQNDPDKPLGRIEDAMAGEAVELDVRMSGGDLPDAGAYDGLAVLPGLADPDDDVLQVHHGRRAIEQALGAGIPVLGLCLGGQLLAQVLGGTTYRSAAEVAYREVERTDAAVSDPLLGGAPERFAVFHAHQYAFESPAGATVLLQNEVCVQACRLGDAWAFQCHPETRHEWALGLAARLRGHDSIVLPQTAGFFGANGVQPDQLEADANAADPTARLIAAGIAAGFLERCRLAARV